MMKSLLFHVRESCSGRKAGNAAAEQNTKMSTKSDPSQEVDRDREEGQEVDRDRGEGREVEPVH